jgi:hypothetical protein
MAKTISSTAKPANPFNVLDNLGFGQDPDKTIAVEADSFRM